MIHYNPEHDTFYRVVSCVFEVKTLIRGVVMPSITRSSQNTESLADELWLNDLENPD